MLWREELVVHDRRVFSSLAKCGTVLTVQLLFIVPTLSYSEELSLLLRTAQNEYILHEPVRFALTLRNVSDERQKVAEVSLWDMNMEFTFLEITTPEGELQFRRYQYETVTAIWNAFYEGEPLEPGGSIESFLYPNVSFVMTDGKQRDQYRGLEFTFPRVGTCKVRVCYFVSSFWEHLWKGEGGELYSNPITITFREPDSKEKEILDALWAGGTTEIAIGDDMLAFSFEESQERELERIIEKYPEHALVKYAYFYLARSLVTLSGGYVRGRVESGVELFETLMKRDPDFRYEETRQLLAMGYDRVDRKEDAIKLFSQTLTERPSLENNYRFMSRKIMVETGNNKIAVEKWRFKRRGIKFPEIEE